MDKYKMFREFMYNELGITKEDVKEWTKEAVIEVATKYVENSFKVRSLDLRILDVITDTGGYYGMRTQRDIEAGVKNKVANILAEMLEVKLVKKEG